MGGGREAAGGGAAAPRRAVPFVRQEEDWDCGLACVKMASAALRPDVDASKLTNAALEALLQTRSVWTVDLAYALRALEIPCVMYTTSTQIDLDEYRGMDFYKEIKHDEARVNMRFARAAENGVRVVPRALPRSDLQCLVRNQLLQVAIVLVDVTVLRDAEKSYGRKVLDFVVAAVTGHQFAGHYLLVVDYNAPFYEVRDPASLRSRTLVHEDVLERARKAPGTDEDVLVLGEDLSHL